MHNVFWVTVNLGEPIYELSTNALPFSMFFLSSGKQAAINFTSSADRRPRGKIFSTPLTFKVYKYGSIARLDFVTYTELHVGREEVNTLILEQRTFDEGRRDDTLFAVQTPQQRVGKLGTSIGHR